MASNFFKFAYTIECVEHYLVFPIGGRIQLDCGWNHRKNQYPVSYIFGLSFFGLYAHNCEIYVTGKSGVWAAKETVLGFLELSQESS